ncbi:MAG TPA: carboxylesterase family protein [Burkholderiaceae bacterium]|nr:carboxylesterase family protein [Burkholderiaceae bacterium]
MTRPSRTPRSGLCLWMASAIVLLTACGGDDDTPAAAPKAPDVAMTQNGPVQAIDRLGVRSYFAIPYAAPPTGNARWTPPAPPAHWTTALANTKSAAPCLQTSASPFRLSGDSEDCLYLDVHAPTGDGPLPVMVWIHGGAFNTGGVVTYQDPSALVTKGLIVVPIAYRLGAMGFLGHPTLEATDTSVGNYGVMDQQAALAWVRDNIAVFGGDPNNVTIFGESAGGFSVLTHLASPGSKGLFHKAIVQSGAYGVNGQLSKATLEGNSTTVVNNALTAAAAASAPGVNCGTGSVTAACLRSLPDAVVRTQLAQAFNASMASPTPSVDGKVLPKTIKQIFVDGTNNKVPVLNGSNENEYTLFIAIGELGRRAAAVPPNFDPTNKSFLLSAANYPATAAGLAFGTGVSTTQLTTVDYPLANFSDAALQPPLAASSLGTDVIFACSGYNVSKRVQAQGSPIYAYEFRDQSAIPSLGRDASNNYYLSMQQGAAHSYEIQYLFNFNDGRPSKNAEQAALAAAMATYWTNFARSGNPNGAGVTTWPAFNEATGAIQSLDVASGGGISSTSLTLAQFAANHKCGTGMTWSVLTF